MASYFRQVPNLEYISRNKGEQYISEYVAVKNLFKRGKLRPDIFENVNFFEKYSIIGDERPDNVAYKFYEDSSLDWVVLLSNNILNVQSEWPMTQRTFEKVMLEKYGNYEDFYGGIHHYETSEIKNSLGITVLQKGIQIQPSWKTNGNFVEIVNCKIENISCGTGGAALESGSTVYVYVTGKNNNSPGGILGLKVGDAIIIDNVSERQYNGQHIVKEILAIDQDGLVTGFTYELPFVPNVIQPRLSTPRKEEVHYTVPEQGLNPGNSYYYEYWDPGVNYTVQVPSTSFIVPVTNYEYEMNIEEEKRNIFVLKPRYLGVIFNDMEDIMKYKKGSQQYVSENLKRGDNIRLYN